MADEGGVPKDTYVGILGDFLASPSSQRVPKLDNGFGGDVLIGSREPGLPYNLGWEFHGFYELLKPKKTTGVSNRRASGLGADLTYPFPTLGGVVMPFALAGLGALYTNDTSDLSTELTAMGEVGGGVVSKPLFSWGWRARLDARYRYENIGKGVGDVHVLAGIEIPICAGRKSK